MRPCDAIGNKGCNFQVIGGVWWQTVATGRHDLERKQISHDGGILVNWRPARAMVVSNA